MTSIIEDTGTAPATAAGSPPKAAQKASVAKRARHRAPPKAQASRKASPGPESTHQRDEGPPRSRRQPDREDPGPAAAARRRDCPGTAESHRLAAAFHT